MKVVINACFGGFSLSPEATLELFKRGGKVEATPVAEYFARDTGPDDPYGHKATLTGWREYLALPDGARCSSFITVFSPDESLILGTRPDWEISEYDGSENVEMLYDGEWRGDGLADGYYDVAGKSHHFEAGSYGGYSVWRDQLACLVGRTAREIQSSEGAVGPFVELIDFSDCEGFIGPQTSAKLARDFIEHQGNVERHAATLGADDGDWFVRRYADWRKAFELAAGEGVVEFC